MKNSRVGIVVGLLLFSIPRFAAAQAECSGFAKKNSFSAEVKAVQEKYQANIIEYRKLEARVAELPSGSPEAAAASGRMAALKAEGDKQKKVIEEFTSPYLPSTEIIALGAACRDMRWMKQAKEVLMAKPELLGRRFYVWMEKGTRKFQAAEKRPNHQSVQFE